MFPSFFLPKQRPEQPKTNTMSRKGVDGYDERAIVRAGGRYVFVEDEKRGSALQTGLYNQIEHAACGGRNTFSLTTAESPRFLHGLP